MTFHFEITNKLSCSNDDDFNNSSSSSGCSTMSSNDRITGGVISYAFRGLSAGFLLQSGAAVSGNVTGATLSLVQSLAVTGLNMLSQSRPEVSASNRKKR